MSPVTRLMGRKESIYQLLEEKQDKEKVKVREDTKKRPGEVKRIKERDCGASEKEREANLWREKEKNSTEK